MFKKSDWTDQKVEVIIGNLLRAGVSLAAAIVFAGGLLFLVRHGVSHPSYRVFDGEPADLTHWKGIIHAAISLQGRGIIQLGLLFLIATPVARVAFAAWAFAMERDWLYVGVSTLVLLILLYSLVGSSMM
jgi:uncharacterized membrane protein